MSTAVEKLSLLVVDDEPGIRLGVARVLRDHTVRLSEVEGQVGFVTAEAATGEEALQAIASAPPDIVLLDHKLPGIQGMDVLEELRRRNGDVLVVMITAYATIETAVAATRRGAHDFLAKPFTPEELKSTVYKAAKHLVLQREARRLAAEKRRVRFQFVSVLAHELKAPLAAVQGYLELLREGVVAPQTPKYEEVIARSGERIEGMRKLIADLLDLTRIESGERPRDLVALELTALAAAALERARPAAEDRGVTLELHAAGPVTLRADADEIGIVLDNLLSNAVKYNRKGGRVDVTVARGGRGASLSVADTGIGLDAEEQARLFGEFVRIRNERTKGIPGSGLGLSIVKKLALLYDGDVAVSGAPGEGSTFTVVLRDATGAEGGR